MSHGGRSSDSHPSALDGMPREGGGETSPAGSPIPRHSVERTASAETVRPADASAGAHDHPPPVPNAHSDCVVVPAATDGPRSPLVIRQPGAPSTPRHAPNVHPSQAVSSPSVLPPRPPPDPSVTAIGRSSVHGSSARPNPSLPTALQRSSPYSQGEPPHSADDESGSAEETEVEAVRTEVRETWDHGQPDNRTPTVHQPQHHSAGGSRWRDSQRGGRYDDDNDDDDDGDDDDSDVYDIHRRHHPFADKGRPRSPPNRHRYDEEDDTSSSGRTDSDASYTLKDRQDAINIIHPFGLKIWKPALYKKKRSVEQTAEREIHSRPGQWPDQKIRIGNVLWTLIFGWWMCILTLLVALMLLVPTWYSSGLPYSVVLFGLAKYLLYPFGRFVELTPDEVYAAEDEGEGHNISEYERYGAVDLERGRQLGIFFNSSMARSHGRRRGQSLGDDSEHDSLLGGDRAQAVRHGEEDSVPTKKRRYFGRGQWNVGRILFFISFYLIIAPVLLLVSGICWLTVFALPMSKVMSLLASHLRRHPLSMTFHSDLRTAASRRSGTPPAQVLVCTYRALGWEYYKYTIDGTNIFFVNLNFVVLFTIADQYLLAPLFHHKYWFVHPAFIFSLALASIIPLSYFIGMAVASISAQSSMGTGAAINAFFGSVIEVYLYSVALTQGKSRLVEGSIVGNIFAGTLLMPGTSMLFGALRHKTQHFNAKSAGVTSTMLLFSVIGAFAPTILYQIYGNAQLRCSACEEGPRGDETCQKCYWEQANVLTDPFYISSVKPFGYICSVFLAASYVIGLWFTLRTHVAQIWETPLHSQDYSLQPLPPSVTSRRDSNAREPLLKHIGRKISSGRADPGQSSTGIHSSSDVHSSSLGPSSTSQDTVMFVRNVAGDTAAADTVTVSNPKFPAATSGTPGVPAPISMVGASPKLEHRRTSETRYQPRDGDHPDADLDEDGAVGGHDAPNWSRTKSSVILFGATILYAIIAEILVDTVDVVLGAGSIDEKFLGLTLFALVPSAIEFLNAISFALNENIALRQVPFGSD